MKKEKGITLIALIVSIIVMLILVVVTINIVFEGGLIDKAKQAKEDTDLAAKNDTNMIIEAGDRITDAVGGEIIPLEPLEPVAMIKNGAGKYEMSVPGNLQWLAEQVNLGNFAPEEGEDGVEIILMNNINYEYHLYTPIGVFEETESGIDVNKVFTGTFDGNGKTISRIYINETEKLHAGLFGLSMDSEIKNITISNSIIKGKQVGAVLGAGAFTTISNCHSIANIIKLSIYEEDLGGMVGGIAGILAGNCLVENCSNNSQIAGFEAMTGGIIGLAFDQFSPGEGNSIIGCTNSGEIIANYGAAGIVCTYGYESPRTKTDDEIKNCINSGNISTSEEEGIAVGIVSININPEIIINCQNTGTLIGNQTYDIYYYQH